MAITSFDVLGDKIPKTSFSAHSSKGGNSCRLLKINYADNSLSSGASKRNKLKKLNSRSPYLTSDRVQLLSRITEKRLVHKTTADFVSSFPLAVNIYKVNSDEIKLSKKINKKVKKSVLTLPNVPAPVPQVCTVSDVNDSEYNHKDNEDRKQKVIKRRSPIQKYKNARVREKDIDCYDRDARCCSQLNLDCSSTDIIKNYNGDCKRVYNRKKTLPTNNKAQAATNDLSDVWTMLRNINRFQFRPSPPVSEESIVQVKKKIQKRPRRLNHKDARVIETCRTEEFAYISSYEMGQKSPNSNLSPSSSIGRITVIDKQNEFNKICQEFEKRLLTTHNFLKDSNNTKSRNIRNKIQSRIIPKSNTRAKENKHNMLTLKKKSKASKQYKSGLTINDSENIDSSVDAENDNLDTFSHTDSMCPANGSYTFTEYSGSSNADVSDVINEQICRNDKPAGASNVQIKEPFEEKLNKEQEATINLILPKQCGPQKRKPRLVTTMPSSCVMPKLTQTEIKRRLANIKFPIVILGKDQVSSGIQVMEYDPPQFNGLDEHIWPFMMEWSPNTAKDKQNHTNTVTKKCPTVFTDSNKLRKNNTELNTDKQAVLKDKKQINHYLPTNKNKTDPKRPTPTSDLADKFLQCTKKQKSIVQLKDKMLNFLYEKSSNHKDNHQNEESKPKNTAVLENKDALANGGHCNTPVDVLVLNNESATSSRKRDFPNPFPIVDRNRGAQNYVYPWAKAKWASDFIENVIKKIRNGVYYTHDQEDFCQIHRYQIDLKEVSVQAGSLYGSADSTQTYDSETDLVLDRRIHTSKNNITNIPGFNNTLPLLEIKTLNMNQIAVKHCMTNVMVQFDVTVPSKSDITIPTAPKISQLIPVEVTESQTKVYKCKTSILNAMLPAELCSLVPVMMNNILEAQKVPEQCLSICPDKSDSFLSTITESTRNETGGSLSASTPSSHTSSAISQCGKGRFTNVVYKKVKREKVDYKIDYNHALAELLPTVLLDDLLQFEVSPRLVEIDNSQDMRSQISALQAQKQISCVTDIQKVETFANSGRGMCSVFEPYNLVGMIESILRKRNLQIYPILNSYLDTFLLQYNGKNIEIDMVMTNDYGVQKKVLVKVSNLQIDSLYEAFPKTNNRNLMNKPITPLKCIEYNTSFVTKSDKTVINQLCSNTLKRKGYKLYRKCKSTTNIPSGEKIATTPLNKILTLDDFFQVLGSKKILSSIFDGYSEKKILSSIIEMKNWITEINPKQALLILLLINKKDTQNLVRFRQIILQGIAVNRITRASELDMEIEVIERENLNKFSQFEGVYLPESVTNYDNLTEELYWIAKTTASDYQKPFDESSEKLLKSLLEKRKKLNPSYLRVMARYVGLGLLKPPTKS